MRGERACAAFSPLGGARCCDRRALRNNLARFGGSPHPGRSTQRPRWTLIQSNKSGPSRRPVAMRLPPRCVRVCPPLHRRAFTPVLAESESLFFFSEVRKTVCAFRNAFYTSEKHFCATFKNCVLAGMNTSRKGRIARRHEPGPKA